MTDTTTNVETPKRRGRKPKPKPPEVSFDFEAYLRKFGKEDGRWAEHWVRPTQFDYDKRTASNIIIEPNRRVFWYFGTYGPVGCTDADMKPNKGFQGISAAPYPNWCFGRRFVLKDYDAKIKKMLNPTKPGDKPYSRVEYDNLD